MLRNSAQSGETQRGSRRGRSLGAAAIEMAIAAIAGRQHGLITTRQLLRVGLTKGAIEYRTQIGRLHRVYQGVYAVGYRPVSPLAKAMAAVLAGGPAAALSHRSAATLWGIDNQWRSPLEVTTHSGRTRQGLRVHRSKTLTRRDITTHFGIPVTTPARTVLDNAPRLGDRALARAVDDLRLARYLHLADLAELWIGIR